MAEPPDEYTPRERGLLIGADWARLALARDDMLGDPERVAAEGIVPAALRDYVMRHPDLRERLDASVEPDAEDAFWRGFVHGVRAAVVELRQGNGAPLLPPDDDELDDG